MNRWPPVAGPMADQIRSHPWETSPLGPIETWPHALRTVTTLILSMPGPAAVFWGPDLVQLYNDSYAAVVGKRQPMLLGSRAREGWADEYDDVLAPMLRDACAGKATSVVDFLLAVQAPADDRSTRAFDSAWSPILDDDGACAGVLQTLVTVTDRRREKESGSEKGRDVTAVRPNAASPRQATESEVDLAAGVANRTWTAVERVRTDGPTGARSQRQHPSDVWLAAQKQAFQTAMNGGGLEASLGALVAAVSAQAEAGRHGAFYVADRLGSPLVHVVGMPKGAESADGQRELSFEFDARQATDGVSLAIQADEPRWKHSAWLARQHRHRECWLFPVETATGQLVGSLALFSDGAGDPTPADLELATRVIPTAAIIISRHQETEERVRSEERLQQFGEASQDVLWIRDATTLQWKYLTPAFESIYGLRRDQALAGNNYRSWLDLIVPEDRQQASDAVGRVLNGESVTFEYRIRRPADGTIRWLRDTDFPIRNAEGQVVLIGGTGTDFTDSRSSRDRLLASEERLRSAIEVGRLALWDWDIRTNEVHWSDEHFRMEGYVVGAIKPSYQAWVARLHPDDRLGTEAALQHAMDNQLEYAREFRVVHPDGSIHWLNGRGRFFYDADNRPVRMVGAMIETTDRREWEDRQMVLLAELQHRTRNLLGVIRAMAEKTVRRSTDLAEFRAGFFDRLAALARAQDLLSRLASHDRVTFDSLIDTELAAMDGAADRVSKGGPKGVRLRSSAVQVLSMALHELATNAVKYGAFKDAGGHLDLKWWVDASGEGGRQWLHIDWRETGIVMPPPGSAPRGSGQGRQQIERALPYQLGAKTSFRFEPHGVHCQISVPISRDQPDSSRGVDPR